ncbi:heparan sulfate glucosamine 3-o-sulfotransferase 3b1 [Plakobranchus ocellatus]|uniref:Heparan sulfate glucosamine 3-o-sulfotransferase 3b1 n=1 Tax=Plakobranchus ocellatus TaxID=259542 RepID=A0AAV3ZC89_9GAST|nr:heparan sulfate glucosamine 3-o-sulfotransferase 3b1 [Plakobranchus ocellatus]
MYMCVCARVHDSLNQIDPENHERLYLTNSSQNGLMVRNDSKVVSGGIYARHLMTWLSYFPLQQIHILDGLDLVTQPAREVHKLETFLDVPHILTQGNFIYNASRGFYCLRAVCSPYRVKCLGKNKGVSHPTMKPSTRRLMYEFYRPHNEEFFRVIGRRFDWEPT